MIRWLADKVTYSVAFDIIVVLAIGAGLFFYHERQAAVAPVIRISYTAGGPVRKHFLDQLVIHGKERHLDIRLVAADGSEKTLSMLDTHAADLGLITGAIEDHAERQVFEITPLYIEPLQLLVREELFDAVSRDFGQLKGKTIGLDGDSATNLLATELLRFIGLADPTTGTPYYQPVHIEASRLTYQAERSSLPEAIFQIAGVPSAGIRSVIAAHNYRLVALPFGVSFNLDKFREAESPDFYQPTNLRLNRAFVEEATIPTFAYSVLPAVPPADIRTVATRLILVGSANLDNRLVHQVLELIFSPEISSLAQPKLTVDLLNTSYEFPRHPGTEKYLSSLQPVDVEGVFTTYGRLVEVWGILGALYFGAAKGLKTWRERQLPQKKRVGDFMAEVLAVEAEAGSTGTANDRARLDQRLSDIKRECLELHFDDDLEDGDELQSLLVTIADTRTRIWGRVS